MLEWLQEKQDNMHEDLVNIDSNSYDKEWVYRVGARLVHFLMSIKLNIQQSQ